LAERIGMDPLEFRLRNCLRPGLTSSTGQVMNEGCGIEATLQRLQAYMAEHDLHFSKSREIAA